MMAEGMNRVTLLGNLGADPELRYTQGGAAVLNLRVATTESYLDRDGERKERTDWHNVVVWGKRAEGLSRILQKGSCVLVEGSLRTSSFEAKDGSGKRYRTEINARNIVLPGRGGSDGGQHRERQEPSRHERAKQDGYQQQDDDDDIPF
jgi:single-strand DNA-binding protein